MAEKIMPMRNDNMDKILFFSKSVRETFWLLLNEIKLDETLIFIYTILTKKDKPAMHKSVIIWIILACAHLTPFWSFSIHSERDNI